MSEVPLPENHDVLNELCRLLRFSQGEFALILAVCNSIKHRSLLVDQLRQQCSIAFDEITLAPTAITLFTTVNAYISSADPTALMVYGLNEVQDSEQLLTATNQIREEFRKFSFPLVLWLTDSDLKHIIRTAPDFYTWANPITFETPPSFFLTFIDELIQNVWQQVSRSQENRFLTPQDLGLTVNSAEYQELETSLAALAAQTIRLSPAQEADLEFVRGRIANNNRAAAREHYQRSLEKWQTLVTGDDDDPRWQAKMGHVQFYLGLWWRTHAERHRPDFDLAFGNACQYFAAAIETFEGIEASSAYDNSPSEGEEDYQQDLADSVFSTKQALVAKYINYLAESLHRLEQWDDLEVVATRARSLHQQQQNPFRVARAEGFLAEVACARENWATAQDYADSALELIYSAELYPQEQQDADFYNWVNSFHRSWYLFSLGKAQVHQGDIDAAVFTFAKARRVTQPDYDPKLYSLILEQLQNGYFQQGHYLPAFETRRQRDAIESRFNYRAFVGAGRLQPKQQIVNPALPSEEIFKDVIVASGRKKAVNDLVRRLAQDEYVLTIVYGPSGVGKSSLIEAGLVPALKQERIETRRVVPVYLRRYRNWVEDLVKTLTAIDSDGSSYSSEIFSYVQDSVTKEVNLPATSTLASPEKVLRRLKYQTQKNQVLVLIFDQFEEFFFEFEKTADRRPFYDFLRSCLTMPYVKVLLSLREDYIHYLLECDRITNIDIVDNNILDKKWLYYVGNFSLAETLAVFKDLTGPTPYSPEEDLIEQVVNDLAAGAGEVRPIELQIVGAQLQEEKITTRKEYLDWRDPNKPTKNLLVEQYLDNVLCACGPKKNQQLADLILYFLTNEQGLRPLKTRAALFDDLLDFGEHDLEDKIFHLILQILTKSGLVMEVPELPEARYQLVHDYLASFMREQKQSLKIEQLHADLVRGKADLAKEKKARAKVESRLLRFLQVFGMAAFLAFITVSILLFQTRSLSRQAQENEVKRLLAASATFHQADKAQLIEPLLNSLEAAEKFVKQDWDKPELESRIALELQRSLSKIREINRFDGHSKSVIDVVYSDDGKKIASAGDDGVINIRHQDGRLVSKIPAHQDGIRSIAFSPDANVIASASHDQTIKFWSLDGTLLKTLSGHTDKVNDVVFSPDGQTVVSASADRTIRIWNVDTGREVRTLRGHTSWVNSVDFSSDGQRLVSSSSDKTIRLWTAEGQDLGVVAEHKSSINQVVFSPDDQRLASASTDRTVKLWTLDGQLIQTMDAHQGKVWDVSFSPDGQFLVSASSDRTLRLWNLQGTLLGNYRSSDDQATFFGVSFSPDGGVFSSASADERVSLWEFRTRDRALVSQAEQGATTMAVTNGNESFISGYQDGTIKLWNASGNVVGAIQAHTQPISALSYSVRGDFIASASDDGKIKLWRNNGELIRDLEGHEQSISLIRFNPKDDSITSADKQGLITLWNSQGELIRSFRGSDTSISSMSYSPDGQLLALGSEDGSVSLWHREGTRLKSLKHHQYPISSIWVSPNGDQIASVDINGKINVSSIRSGQSLYTKNYLGRLTDSVYTDSDEVLAVASTEGQVHFWHFPTDTTIATLDIHRSGATILLDFDSDNHILLSLGSDGRLYRWNLNIDELMQSSCSLLGNYLPIYENLKKEKFSLCQSSNL